MLNNTDFKLISLADAVAAEVLYEVAMNVKFSSFYSFKFQKTLQNTEKLNYNLYKYTN